MSWAIESLHGWVGHDSNWWKYGDKFKEGDKISLFIDRDLGSIIFVISGKKLGTTFKHPNLRKLELYPCLLMNEGSKVIII